MAADEIFEVMVGQEGSGTVNNLMVGRWDLVLPLERDLDDDPLHDDEVWLQDADGKPVRTLLCSDDDVTEDPDSGLLLYKFRDVPFGVYSVAVVVGGQPKQVVAQIVVRAQGVFIGDDKLPEDFDKAPIEREAGAVEAPAEEPPAELRVGVCLCPDDDAGEELIG